MKITYLSLQEYVKTLDKGLLFFCIIWINLLVPDPQARRLFRKIQRQFEALRPSVRFCVTNWMGLNWISTHWCGRNVIFLLMEIALIKSI